MAKQVVMGAMMKCSFGTAPASLLVIPADNSMTESKPTATIMDHKPMANIPPFAMCNSLSNPTVASATSAALGVLTPMPCVPVTTAPWAPGSPQNLIGGKPALNDTSKCMCNWGGVIEITQPGTTQSEIP